MATRYVPGFTLTEGPITPVSTGLKSAPDYTGDVFDVPQNYVARLRSGAPINTSRGDLVLHVFGSERSRLDIKGATNNLPSSKDFRGRKGPYLNASFSRIADVGGDTFSGRITYPPEYSSACLLASAPMSDAGFIDCTSLNISYDVLGMATLTFAIVHETNEIHLRNRIELQTAPPRTFVGFVTNVSVQRIPNTAWFESHVTLLATTDDVGNAGEVIF